MRARVEYLDGSNDIAKQVEFELKLKVACLIDVTYSDYSLILLVILDVLVNRDRFNQT